MNEDWTKHAQVGLFHANNHNHTATKQQKSIFHLCIYFELIDFSFGFRFFLSALLVCCHWGAHAHTRIFSKTETKSFLHCWFVNEKHKKADLLHPKKWHQLLFILLVVFVFSFALLCSIPRDQFSTKKSDSECVNERGVSSYWSKSSHTIVKNEYNMHSKSSLLHLEFKNNIHLKCLICHS